MSTISFTAWLQQATTGIGAAVLAPTAVAYATGQMTGQQAAAAAVGGVILTLWPEAPKQQVETLAADAVALAQAAIQLHASAPTLAAPPNSHA